MAQTAVFPALVVMTLKDTTDVTRTVSGSVWRAIRMLTPTALCVFHLMDAVSNQKIDGYFNRYVVISVASLYTWH